MPFPLEVSLTPKTDNGHRGEDLQKWKEPQSQAALSF